MEQKTIIFGDTHGHSDRLEKLILRAKAVYGPHTMFYHTGDMIDRGPDSKGVIQLCIDHNVGGVKGNHEWWLQEFCRTGRFDDFALHDVMGGRETLRSYGIDRFFGSWIEKELPKLIPEDHKAYILNLPAWRKVTVKGRVYRLIHAGLKEGDARAFLGQAERLVESRGGNVDDMLCEELARVNPTNLHWTAPNMASPNLYRFQDGGCQVFGHMPQETVRIAKHWISLDTGCGTCKPDKLSAVVLPDRVPLEY